MAITLKVLELSSKGSFCGLTFNGQFGKECFNISKKKWNVSRKIEKINKKKTKEIQIKRSFNMFNFI